MSIILTKLLNSSVGGKWCWQALGPGFDSQVPHLFHIFCFKTLLCSIFSKVHHIPSPACLPHVQQRPSKGHDESPRVHTSQCLYTQVWKVKRASISWARLLTTYLLNLGQHPQCLHNLSISFLLFSFFYFILLTTFIWFYFK